MIEYLIKAALIITPFVVCPGMDSRTPKEIFAFSAVLVIVLYAFHNGLFKKFNNIWALLFVGFCWLSLLMAPAFPKFVLAYLEGDVAAHRITAIGLLPDRPVSGMWMFKPVLFIFLYFIYMTVIASIDLTREKINSYLKMMMYCGMAMALYIFIQKAGMDQFFGFVSKSYNPDIQALKEPALGGFMGQSTIVSPFIAMTVPLAVYFRKYLLTALMSVAVVLTLSKMAIGALALGMIPYILLSKHLIHKLFGIIVIVAVALTITAFINTNKDGIETKLSQFSSGRSAIWPVMFKDIITPQADGRKHAVTGLGPGSFSFVFSSTHRNRWWQAHNEPLEALYNFGIIGVMMLSLAVYNMISHLRSFRDELILTLLRCLLIVLLCSLGTFSLQIAPIYLYVLTMLGFLHNSVLAERDHA